MATEYILLFSDKCTFCNTLLGKLNKNPKLDDSIIKQNIHNKDVFIPSDIKTVPALIHKEGDNYTTYQGKEVFNWIDSQISRLKPVNDIVSYDPTTMGMTMSDSFSNLDDNSPMSHCYQFLNNTSYNNKIDMSPPQATSSDKKPINDKKLEEFIKMRNQQIPNELNRV
tara:strand:+ start:3983 stop:4486 length:504 start_codon:yes stop_codon:yes gene_type:complete